MNRLNDWLDEPLLADHWIVRLMRWELAHPWKVLAIEIVIQCILIVLLLLVVFPWLFGG